MKKLIAITAVILFGCLFISSFSATQVTQNGVKHTATYNEKETAGEIDEQNQIYIIKAEDGKLTVYKKGDAAPYMHTNTFVNTLPKGDILRLENGIEVTGKENLKKYLEDYCS